MNFANLKSFAIPEGNVAKITNDDGIVLWEKVKELTNYFIPEQATLNVAMGISILEAKAGYVWSNAIPVDMTKETPFRIKVEGTKITEDQTSTQKLWLCSDSAGTVKTSAAIMQLGLEFSGNFTTLLEDGTVYADYKGNAKLADSIINQIKVVRIGFKFSDTAIASADELKDVKITILSDI